MGGSINSKKVCAEVDRTTLNPSLAKEGNQTPIGVWLTPIGV